MDELGLLFSRIEIKMAHCNFPAANERLLFFALADPNLPDRYRPKLWPENTAVVKATPRNNTILHLRRHPFERQPEGPVES